MSPQADVHRVGWRLFPEDARQALRLKRFFMAFLAYLLWIGLTFYCYALGYINISAGWFAFSIALTLLGNLVFFGLFRSGLNRRWPDPSLTMPQMLLATFWVMLLVAMAPRVRGILLLLYVVIFLFGIFRLRRGQYLLLTALALAGYGIIVLRTLVFQGGAEPMSLELLQYAVLIVTLVWLSFFGSYVGQLRDTVTRRNRELREALRRNRELAIHDDLTGAYNRRHILQMLEQEHARALRTARGFGVCLMDLDNFKGINDQHGHLAGDAVLREFVVRVMGEIRELDQVGQGKTHHETFGRYGGEEFLLLLPETDAEGSHVCAERIRARIADETLRVEGIEVSLSVSIGVTVYHAHEDIRATLARADQALYRAKQNGRNRVESLPGA
ncbi:MAG TPA: GGDEF domain-containing protein [Gammaproteobacteria bacterium]|nr:GGDEF domain-containing protein [Gammaproteobacteria bacterium]